MIPSHMPPMQPVTVSVPGCNLKLMTYIGDHITDGMTTGEIYESELLRTVLERYGIGGVYVDFGAFIGTHSLYFAKVCCADVVISVEPNPKSHYLLMLNAWLNDAWQIETFCCAVSNKQGRVWLNADPHNRAHCVASATDTQAYTTPMMRAVDLITLPPKLVKIDTEGWSLPILESILPIIEEHHPVIVVETTDEDREEVDSVLRNRGYGLVRTFEPSQTHLYEHGYEESTGEVTEDE